MILRVASTPVRRQVIPPCLILCEVVLFRRFHSRFRGAPKSTRYLWPLIGFPDPLQKVKLKDAMFNITLNITMLKEDQTKGQKRLQLQRLVHLHSSTWNFHAPPWAVGHLGLVRLAESRGRGGLNTTKTREHIGIQCLDMEHSIVFPGAWIYMKRRNFDITINIGMLEKLPATASLIFACLFPFKSFKVMIWTLKSIDCGEGCWTPPTAIGAI